MGTKRAERFRRSWDLASQEFQLKGQGSWVFTPPPTVFSVCTVSLQLPPIPGSAIQGTHQGLAEAGGKTFFRF